MDNKTAWETVSKMVRTLIKIRTATHPEISPYIEEETEAMVIVHDVLMKGEENEVVH